MKVKELKLKAKNEGCVDVEFLAYYGEISAKNFNGKVGKNNYNLKDLQPLTDSLTLVIDSHLNQITFDELEVIDFMEVDEKEYNKAHYAKSRYCSEYRGKDFIEEYGEKNAKILVALVDIEEIIIEENEKEILIKKLSFNDCAMLVKREQLAEWLDELCKLETGIDSIEEVGEVLCSVDNLTPLIKCVYGVFCWEQGEEVIDFILDSELFKNVMEEQEEKMRKVAKENFMQDEVISIEAVNYMDDWFFGDFKKILKYYY